MRGLVVSVGLVGLVACVGPTEPPPDDDLAACDGPNALASCSTPTMDAEHYVLQSQRYFDTMDRTVDHTVPDYSELVARWEWPPWLKLTAFGLDNIHATDTLLLLYPSVVVDRDCRAFDTQPFGRCKVTFYYDDASHEGRGCPIYEEFIFNDAGEVTWIEAWSDLAGYRPMAVSDPWAEAADVPRLGSRVPGLGTPTGLVDLDGEAMLAAAETDVDIADFLVRANDWYGTWTDELSASGGDDMWIEGCGW